MKVALYARVSTQRQALTQNIEQQLERLQAHVQAQVSRSALSDLDPALFVPKVSNPYWIEV